ncbi:MAG: radical SAM protein [Candidatus Aminicenantes bacterium RBG_13_63_10]|nr:MAG: radical SAM protein [Candidatus Aminicenantes bacterium RBG_13_63_10]
MEAAVIVTYRCGQKCVMCRTWEHPTRPEEEFTPSLLRKLPRLAFANITGGEPFLRDDIEEIVALVMARARRVVVSTNGQLTDRILDVARRRRGLGIRVSLEGLSRVNDRLRGVEGGFDRGLRTILRLLDLGMKDVGFGITLSDENADDLLDLYLLAKRLKVEFATAAVHNSFYFHAGSNRFERPEAVARSLERLTEELLRSRRPKDWFRAYFNRGLVDYVLGRPRLLPCPAGTDLFFLDPFGEVYPCNGLEPRYWQESLGNLRRASFEEIWNSEKASAVRALVRDCPKRCWMIGTASPAMKKHLLKPALWVARHKLPRRRRPA